MSPVDTRARATRFSFRVSFELTRGSEPTTRAPAFSILQTPSRHRNGTEVSLTTIYGRSKGSSRYKGHILAARQFSSGQQPRRTIKSRALLPKPLSFTAARHFANLRGALASLSAFEDKRSERNVNIQSQLLSRLCEILAISSLRLHARARRRLA